MFRRLPAPTVIHRIIAWARDGKWLRCPCCGTGFGTHQVIVPAVTGRLYNRISYLCPACAAARGNNVVVITPPRPCACPDCGHVETSLAAMGRHLIAAHQSRSASNMSGKGPMLGLHS